MSLETGTASRDRWLESKELQIAGREFTSKSKQGCFRPRNEKGMWGSSPKSSTSLVSSGDSCQMFVRALWNDSQRFCCFMSNEAVTEATRLASSQAWLLVGVTVVHSSVCWESQLSRSRWQCWGHKALKSLKSSSYVKQLGKTLIKTKLATV